MNNLILPSTSSEGAVGKIDPYITEGGALIFRIPLNAFPGLWGYIYVVLVDHYRVLIDTGSGFGVSNQHLEEGLQTASHLAGVDVTLPNIRGWCEKCSRG